MIAPLAKFIDWSALQMAYAAYAAVFGLKHEPRLKRKLEEALEFLNGPDFIPAASAAAQIEFDGPRNFQFPTPLPGKAPENNVVYGRFDRCAERWQERPAIILLDGAFGVGYHTGLPLLARRIKRAGFNAATLVAANNLQRRSRQPTEQNCLEFAREIAQNVAEIRALIGWLLNEGCVSVGLLGVSFGGWLAGLTACSDPRIACAALTVPQVRLRCSQPIIWRRAREFVQSLRLGHDAMDTTRLNLVLSMPVIPKENILLIDGIYNLFGEWQWMEDLWQKWEQPEFWRLPHGHISALFVPGLTARVLRWLDSRLNAPARCSRQL
jgi:hypothetical protein